MDFDSKEFVKIHLDWNYKGQVDLSLQLYLQKALKQFNATLSSKKQDFPYPHTPPNHGACAEYATTNTLPQAGKDAQKLTQQVTGSFLWMASEVNSTLLTALSTSAAQQANPTHFTMKCVIQSLTTLHHRSLLSSLATKVTW